MQLTTHGRLSTIHHDTIRKYVREDGNYVLGDFLDFFFLRFCTWRELKFPVMLVSKSSEYNRELVTVIQDYKITNIGTDCGKYCPIGWTALEPQATPREVVFQHWG